MVERRNNIIIYGIKNVYYKIHFLFMKLLFCQFAHAIFENDIKISHEILTFSVKDNEHEGT